jgi:hypothetical protein
MQYYSKERVIFPMPDTERENYERWAEEREARLDDEAESKMEQQVTEAK